MLQLRMSLRLRLLQLVLAHLPGALGIFFPRFYAVHLKRSLLCNTVSVDRLEDSFVNDFEVAGQPQVLYSLYDFRVHLGDDFASLVSDIHMERSDVVASRGVGIRLVFA